MFFVVQVVLGSTLQATLMVEKGIRVGTCHAVHQYAKVDNKYMKDYEKNKESSYLK